MIKINDKYSIYADNNSIIVVEPVIREVKGAVTEGYKNAKYYGTLEQALDGTAQRLLREAIQDGSVTTLAEAAEQLRRISAELKKCLLQ